MYKEQKEWVLELFCNSIGGSVLILSDFNFHYGRPDDPYVSKYLDLLHVYNLEQSVHVPTHKKGHILDWIVYQPDDCQTQLPTNLHLITWLFFAIWILPFQNQQLYKG